MATLSFDAVDIRFRGSLKTSGWTLCIGAGVSIGLLPSWSELSRKLLNRVVALDVSADEFSEMTHRTGWAFDAWIQAALNAHLANGGDLKGFTTLVEEVLYEDLRQRAAENELDDLLLTAFGNPHLLSSDEFRRVLAFLKEGPASVLALSRVLLEARSREALPLGIITFNYDTLLETIVRMLQISEHASTLGRHVHPPAFLKRVTGPSARSDGHIPIYYIHGCLTPSPRTWRGRLVRDSKASIVGAEASYLRIASSPFTWPQTVFLHHAQTTSLLILGHSLSDANLRRWLSWATEVRNDEAKQRRGQESHVVPHVWLRLRGRTEAERRILQTSVSHLGVRIGWLDSWSDVGPALQNLLATNRAPLQTVAPENSLNNDGTD